jgi:DNA-binding transcriptional LysR family regulator
MWVRGPDGDLSTSDPLPLVTMGEGCVMHRLATDTLGYAGRDHDIVFTTFSLAALLSAVAVGLGVTLLPSRGVSDQFGVCEAESLPKSCDLWGGIYLREGIDRDVLEELADTMAEALRPRPEGLVPARAPAPWPAVAENMVDAVPVRAAVRS